MVTIRQQLSKTVVSLVKKNTWSYQETKKEWQVDPKFASQARPMRFPAPSAT
jgi:hypothetical protein